MTFPLLMLLRYRLYLRVIFIDRLMGGLGPVHLLLYTLLMELVNLNLNVKKGHMEFQGHLWCCSAAHIYNNIKIKIAELVI